MMPWSIVPLCIFPASCISFPDEKESKNAPSPFFATYSLADPFVRANHFSNKLSREAVWNAQFYRIENDSWSCRHLESSNEFVLISDISGTSIFAKQNFSPPILSPGEERHYGTGASPNAFVPLSVGWFGCNKWLSSSRAISSQKISHQIIFRFIS